MSSRRNAPAIWFSSTASKDVLRKRSTASTGSPNTNQPLCVEFEGARDVDGDGAIEVSAGVAASSRIRQTRFSAIWVFPEGTKIDKPESVASGAMKDKCIRLIDVGATPEQDWANQNYDKSDVSFARMRLDYAETIAARPNQDLLASRAAGPPPRAGEHVATWPMLSATFCPARRSRRSGRRRSRRSRNSIPERPSGRSSTFGRRFFARAARFEVPDPVLNDIFLSRLATRAILEVNLNKELSYNACSPFFYFDHAYRDVAYVILAWDMAGMHDHAEQLLRVYCKDVKDVPKGPIAFDGKPLQLGMLENGLWNTRPGQWDTQGQNIWALVQHYKLSGDRAWLEKTAYPYIRRGAQWIVNSRHKHMAEVKDPKDPRYGLIEPGAMEVMEVGKGTHMYYLNAFGVLGLARGGRRRQGRGRGRRRPAVRRRGPRPEELPPPIVPADVQTHRALRGPPLVRRRAGGRGTCTGSGPTIASSGPAGASTRTTRCSRPPCGTWSG